MDRRSNDSVKSGLHILSTGNCFGIVCMNCICFYGLEKVCNGVPRGELGGELGGVLSLKTRSGIIGLLEEKCGISREDIFLELL